MNPNQWPLIVRDHSPLVWQTAYRLLVNHADAADCLQETFISAWRLSCGQPVKNWPGLLQHLATARALDQLRRRAQQTRHLQTTGMDAVEIPEQSNGPEAQAQLTEIAQQLRSALAQLPVRGAEVYCLRHLNGMSYEQIAAELKMTVSAVGVALHRATQSLRASLAPVVMNEREPKRPL